LVPFNISPRARERSQRRRPPRNFLIIEYRSFADAILPARGKLCQNSHKYQDIPTSSPSAPSGPVTSFIWLAASRGIIPQGATWQEIKSTWPFALIPRSIFVASSRDIVASCVKEPLARFNLESNSESVQQSAALDLSLSPAPFAGRLAFPVESPKRPRD